MIDKMKKYFKSPVYPLFTIGYTVLLSLFFSVCLEITGLTLGYAIDGKKVLDQYPRFVPFCGATFLFATFAIVVLGVLNAKFSKKAHYEKGTWVLQFVFAFVLSVPMIYVWSITFEFLQNTF